MRKAVRSAVVALPAFVVVAMPSVARADGRVALVVGNSTYAHIGGLPNPDNDARDMSAAPRRLGFEVTTELDADRVELTEALRAFTRQRPSADVSLVFYAGHGILAAACRQYEAGGRKWFRDCDDCPEMAVVPAGTFRMGCVSGDGCRNNEHPVHDVEVASFALSKYEVTRGQFAAFVAATDHVARGCYVYALEVRSFARDRWTWETDQQASWAAPGFEQQAIELGGCQGACSVAESGDRSGLPAAE